MQRLSQTMHPVVNRPIRIIQFGEGNFLRAFVDWIVQRMNQNGDFNGNVAVVQPLETGRVKDLSEQDGLYTLILNGVDQGKVIDHHEIIDVLSQFNNPYVDYAGFLELASIETARFIVSNSTEAGIVFLDEEIGYEMVPSSFPGKVLALLKRRYDNFNGALDKGFVFFTCELIDDNGSKLREIVLELAKVNRCDEKFIEWILTANVFCNTLVDRIVPGYPRDRAKEYTETWGYEDTSMVKAEIFHLWVIEAGEEVKKEFPADKAGLNVLFVPDHHPYKERKVKILNGAHTCMVPVAYLLGFDTVRESILDPLVRKFILGFLDDEVLPTISLDKEEIRRFTESVLERFENPFVRHELMSISLNSMTKFKTRILPSIIELDRRGGFAARAWFSLAALVVFYRGVRNDQKINVMDDERWLTYWTSRWEEIETDPNQIRNVVEDFLSQKDHWESDVVSKDEVVEYVSRSVKDILDLGMLATMSKYFGDIE